MEREDNMYSPANWENTKKKTPPKDSDLAWCANIQTKEHPEGFLAPPWDVLGSMVCRYLLDVYVGPLVPWWKT